MDDCDVVSDALHRLQDGQLAKEIQRTEGLIRSDFMFFIFMFAFLFVARTCQVRGTQNRRQFYTRTAVRLGVWIFFFIAWFIVPLLYIRRKLQEEFFADLIIGKQNCKQSDGIFRVCPLTCMQLQKAKLQISEFRSTPSETLVFTYVFFMFWMGFVAYIFRAMRDLPEVRRQITTTEMESILVEDPGSTSVQANTPSTSSTEAIPQDTSNVNEAAQNAAPDCPICLEPLKREPVCRLSCTHRFHRMCMQSWLQTGRIPTCPLCKAELLPS